MSDNNKHENKMGPFHEEAKKKEPSMEDLEQVIGGSGGRHYAHVDCPGHTD